MFCFVFSECVYYGANLHALWAWPNYSEYIYHGANLRIWLTLIYRVLQNTYITESAYTKSNYRAIWLPVQTTLTTLANHTKATCHVWKSFALTDASVLQNPVCMMIDESWTGNIYAWAWPNYCSYKRGSKRQEIFRWSWTGWRRPLYSSFKRLKKQTALFELERASSCNRVITMHSRLCTCA